jgi:hypothetical protein
MISWYGVTDVIFPNPALRLLINHRPERQIVGHIASLTAGAHDVAQGVEHCPQ